MVQCASALLGLAVALSACGEGTVVDVDKSQVADYTSWPRMLETRGAVGGHGDTVRRIYANQTATGINANPLAELYPTGSVIVKEVRTRDGDSAGDIEYLAVMRNLRGDQGPDGAELVQTTGFPVVDNTAHGWLFTYIGGDDVNGDEEYRPSCWDTCHVAAPFDGTFYYYGD